MKVLVTGIDGYSGWPLALHLIARGHEVVGIDNFVTRKRVKEVGSWSATPIPSFAEAPGGRGEDVRPHLRFHQGDLSNYDVRPVSPRGGAARCHRPPRGATQRPYSMIDVHHAVATQVENLTGTLHLLYAMHEVVPKPTS